MSEPTGTPETSMEAILASIRRMIAEDGIQPPPAARPTPLPRPEPSFQSNPSVAEPSPPPSSLSPPPAAAQPAPLQSPVFTMPLVTPAPAVAMALDSQPPASAPAPESVVEPVAPDTVWSVRGDRAGAGEELVLTQMLADDGSVVAVAKRGSLSAPLPSAPLDVLLLTDALPGVMPDVAVPVRPPPKSEPPPRPAPKLAGDAKRPRVGLAAPDTVVTSSAVLEQLSLVRSQVRAASPNPPARSIAT